MFRILTTQQLLNTMRIENSGSYLNFTNGSATFALKKANIASINKRVKDIIIKTIDGGEHKVVYTDVSYPSTANITALYNLLIAYQDTIGRAETFTAIAGQVVYTTTMTLPNVILLFLDGVYQGTTAEMAGGWDVTGSNEVTSAHAIGAGVKVTIMI